MKAKTVKYEELVSTGSYSHAKLGIEVELEDGEKAQDVLDMAKLFVKSNLHGYKDISFEKVRAAKQMLDAAKRAAETLNQQIDDNEAQKNFSMPDEIPF